MEVKKGLRVRNTVSGETGTCTGNFMRIPEVAGQSPIVEVRWDSGKPRTTGVNVGVLEALGE